MDPSPSTPTTDPSGGASIAARMRRELTGAMRAKDQVRVRALRTALGAIANAEAPPIADAPSISASAEPVVGRLVEHRRLDLTEADIERILRAEIADREDTAAQFDAHDRADEAATVRAEAAVLAGYLT